MKTIPLKTSKISLINSVLNLSECLYVFFCPDSFLSFIWGSSHVRAQDLAGFEKNNVRLKNKQTKKKPIVFFTCWGFRHDGEAFTKNSRSDCNL